VGTTGDTQSRDSEQPGNLPVRMWRSVFRRPLVPKTDKERAWTTLNMLLLHLRPVRLPARTLRLTHTWGLGGSSLVLATLLAGTGVLLMLHYQPAPGLAYDSVVELQSEVLFGALVRGMHHWSANLLILVVLLHMARVFLTGAFHGARQFNWVIGCTLLACVLGANFTGYLLPWDQLSYWAVTISTSMMGYVPLIGETLQRVIRGGPELGTATMVTFYTIHTSIIPVCLIVLMSFHFWRVRKAGGVVLPPPDEGEADGPPEKVLFLPNLLLRETVQALVVVALVMVLAVVFAAPLGDPANPGMCPNPAKAPWYFVGFQELLIHLHPVLAVVVIPVLGAVMLLLLPYLTRDDEAEGAWFLTATGRRAAAAAAVVALVVTPLWVVMDELMGSDVIATRGVPGWVGNGVVPVIVLLGACWGLHQLLRRRLGATANEAVQALVVLMAVGFAILTLIGVWFRGEGMALTWPWRL